MTDLIIDKANQMVPCLEKIEKRKRPTRSISIDKFLGIPELGKVEFIQKNMTRQIDIQGNTLFATYYIEEEKSEIGISEDNWKHFQDLTSLIISYLSERKLTEKYT